MGSASAAQLSALLSVAAKTSRVQWHRRWLDEPAPASDAESPRFADRFLVGQDDVRRVVKVADVDWVGSEGNYARFHMGGEGHRLRITMQRAVEVLRLHGFVRIHRSTIVNVRRVVAIRAWGSKDPMVELSDGTTLSASRNYVGALTDVFAHPLTQHAVVPPSLRGPKVASLSNRIV